MKKERLETLLGNFITYINYENLIGMSVDEKLKFFKEEIGFDEEEINELSIVKYLEEK